MAWHLFGIAPKNTDLVTGESADHKTDQKTQTFLKEFYQAYLGMECGTSSPVLQLENLPPEHGRLFNIGLMRHIATAKFYIAKTSSGTVPQKPHRDISGLLSMKQEKAIQSLYCKSAGSVAQPTLFTNIDEALDLLAKNEGGDIEAAHTRWIERLSSIGIEGLGDGTHPLLSPNPGLAFYDKTLPDGRPPGYFIYSRGSEVEDVDFIDEPDPVKRKQKESDYRTFADALETAMNQNASTAPGSLQANTMLLWNDVLVLHGRGPLLGEGQQQNRQIEPVEATHVPHPTDPDGLAHAIGGPCSRVNLDQLTKLGTSDPVKQRARTS